MSPYHVIHVIVTSCRERTDGFFSFSSVTIAPASSILQSPFSLLSKLASRHHRSPPFPPPPSPFVTGSFAHSPLLHVPPLFVPDFSTEPFLLSSVTPLHGLSRLTRWSPPSPRRSPSLHGLTHQSPPSSHRSPLLHSPGLLDPPEPSLSSPITPSWPDSPEPSLPLPITSLYGLSRLTCRSPLSPHRSPPSTV